MIAVFYDKNFTALQNNASLNVGKYEIVKRAVDFDDFSLTSEAFVENVNPCFVVMKNDLGKYVYAGFAGVPTLNTENQTELQASDLKTLFNNEILMQFGTYTYLDDMLEALFTVFNTQVLQGSFAIEVDMTDISDIELDADLIPTTELKVYNVWDDILVNYLKYYDCYMVSELDIPNQKIKYKIKKTGRYNVPLHLYDFGIYNYGKWVASLNETQGVVANNGTLSYGKRFILLADGSITSTVGNRNLYPIKKNWILKETEDSSQVTALLNEANIEALERIVENRYNESIEFNTNNIERYETADFDTNFNVYVKRGELYKTIPLGEIHITVDKNGTEEKKLVVGYKNNDIIKYI